jgi:hypothetical protein
MENPAKDIYKVFNLIDCVHSPDVQKAAVEKYFLQDAGFKYPVFQVEAGSKSRDKVLKLYQCASLGPLASYQGGTYLNRQFQVASHHLSENERGCDARQYVSPYTFVHGNVADKRLLQRTTRRRISYSSMLLSISVCGTCPCGLARRGRWLSAKSLATDILTRSLQDADPTDAEEAEWPPLYCIPGGLDAS